MALRDLFVRRVKDWHYDRIDSAHTPGDIEDTIIEPMSGYLHIFLKSMRLVHDRVAFSTFYPAVHSFISIAHRKGANAEFNIITTPKNLGELDAKNLSDVVNINHRLLGPVPYVGGDLKLEVGLFAIQSGNLVKPFLDVLGEMSHLAGVSYISTVMPYLKPLEKGVNFLINGQGSNLEIGLAETYTTLRSGYYVVLKSPRNKIASNDLRVSGSDFRLTYSNGKLVDEYPYMVLQIYHTKTREDWFMIPDLVEAYQNLDKTIETSSSNDEVQAALKSFTKKLINSKDVLLPHAQSIIEEVKNRIKIILQQSQDDELLRGMEAKKLPPLQSLAVNFESGSGHGG